MTVLEYRKFRILILVDGLKYQLRIHSSAVQLSVTAVRTKRLCHVGSWVNQP